MMKAQLGRIALVLITISIVSPVSAAGLSDSFKNWVLGSEAGATAGEGETLDLDRESAQCVNCHNGKAANHIVLKNAASAMQFSISGRQVNHPIGMLYDDFTASDPRSYQPRARMNPNIGFVDGRVACVSCHKLENTGQLTRYALGAPVEMLSANGEFPAPVDECTSGENLTVSGRTTDLCQSCHTI